MELPSDQEIVALVAAAQCFDEEAFDTLYTLYVEVIFQFFRSRISDYHTAEDLTSNVFLRMVGALPKFSLPAKAQGLAFTAWLFRIAHNQLADHYHSANRRALPLNECWPSPHLPTDEVERRIDAEEIRAALAHLTVEQQRIVLLRFVGELSLEEVATLTRQSVGGVKAMQHRALRRLGQLLQRVKPTPPELARER